MARTIAQRELRNDNARIIDEVARGETFVVTRHGAPVAELRPYVAERRRFVPRAELLAILRSTPAIDLTRFRADLDAVADPYLGS